MRPTTTSLIRMAMAVLPVVAAWSAEAQTRRPWVDPPDRMSPPSSEPRAPTNDVPPPEEEPIVAEPRSRAPSPKATASPAPAERPASRPATARAKSSEGRAAKRERMQEERSAGRASARSTERRNKDAPAVARRPVPVPDARSPDFEDRMPPRIQAGEAGRLARDVVFAYLDRWSAPNAVTFAEMPSFYSDHVSFHGRVVDRGRLMATKRRFAERWPVRVYEPRPGTLRVACAPDGVVCTVDTLLDFRALSPAEGRRSEGVASLRIAVDVSGPRPWIVSENSRVVER